VYVMEMAVGRQSCSAQWRLSHERSYFIGRVVGNSLHLALPLEVNLPASGISGRAWDEKNVQAHDIQSLLHNKLSKGKVLFRMQMLTTPGIVSRPSCPMAVMLKSALATYGAFLVDVHQVMRSHWLPLPIIALWVSGMDRAVAS
jgi:hypothetical protein